jgi:hypothetical protein
LFLPCVDAGAGRTHSLCKKKVLPEAVMCCLLSGVSFLLADFFTVLLVGSVITGADGGLALVGLFGTAILFVFSWALSQFF